MPTVLITGANRGIGLEFARQYAADGWQVHATSRDLARADAIRALDGAVELHRLEVTDKAAIDTLAAGLRGVALDVLIVNAGVLGPRGMPAEMVDHESWLETLHVNAIAPLAIAGAMKPNLLRGKLRKAVALTSNLSSIGSNDTGGLYVYRSSKAALNAVWRSLAIDWRPDRICCALLTPGWVKTDMGGKLAELEPADSVAGMRRVIEGLTLDQSGKALTYRGDEMGW